MKIRSSRLLVGLLAAALSCAAFAADKAAPKAAAPKPVASGPLATVNGQPISRAVYDVFLQDQVSRGAPNNAEIQKARDRSNRVIRMKRRKHQMAGQRRFDRDIGGLRVADFADHQDIRVVS